MSCLTVKNCCHFMNLRLGSFVIVYVCLGFEGLSLLVHSLMARFISIHSEVTGYIYVQRFLIFLFMLIICLKIVLCAALLIGLYKRLPDHLEIWYNGYFLCILLQTAITVCATVKEFDSVNVWIWIIMTERIIITSVSLYFVLVVRSYFFKMCKESNFYQNIVYDRDNTKALNSGKPTKTHTYEELPYALSTGNDTKGNGVEDPQYSFLKNGGGVVYSVPKENTVTNIVNMPMPMPMIFEKDDKQSSMLYPSLAEP